MRVLVCGGRYYNGEEFLFDYLDLLHKHSGPITEVIHGAQRGADQLAGRWGLKNGIKVTRVPAQWEFYGNRAGPIRNQKMLDMKPDIVVACPGGSGTNDMVSKATRAGIRVERLKGHDDGI